MTATIVSRINMLRAMQPRRSRPVKLTRIDYRISASGCYECTSHLPQRGYPKIRCYGNETFISRIVWITAYGPIPDAQVVRHRCDNPACIRLDHLELGTQADNIHDCLARDRFQRGERHYKTSLTEAQVREIRQITGVSARVVAERYGVHMQTIYDIRWRRRWAHVED